jgi:hypothetical protein
VSSDIVYPEIRLTREGCAMSKETSAEPTELFIGTWRLVSSEFQQNGEKTFPLGERPEGLLMYDACGNVAAQLMRRGRRVLGSGNQLGGTPEEIREAFEGYVAYFGTFTVDPKAGRVTHQVQGSLLPNWIGGSQIRFYEIRDDILTLRTEPIQTGRGEITGVLVWRKERGT